MRTAAVPVLRERRVIGDSSIQTQPAKPAVCQIEVDFITEAPFRSYAEAIADQEHPDHQVRIGRGPPDIAVELRQLPPQSSSRRTYRSTADGGRLGCAFLARTHRTTQPIRLADVPS
jgi:hypothetical protein